MEEFELKELIRMFWNKKIHIILITRIFIVIGTIYTIGFVTPMYTSSTTLVLAASDKTTETNKQAGTITTTDVTLNSKLVATYSELVKSKNVLRQVISNLGIKVNEEDLRNNITVSSVKETELIEITVSNENASYAAKIANEIAKVFTAKVGEIYNINNVHVVDEAEVSTNPSNINHTKDIVIFAFIGIVISVMYVLIANMLDTTVKTQEDIEKAIKIPVLANIPIYNMEMENLRKKGGRR
ncbi:MAG: YveK family protein [Clostridia bacterium]